MKNARPGLQVRICDLDDTKGVLAIQRYIKARRNNAIGKIMAVVPGHGGDVWFVRHEDDEVGVYSVNEMESLDEQTNKR